MRTVLFVWCVVLLLVAVSIIVSAVPIVSNGNDTPNSLGTASAPYLTSASNCGQVEIDFFNFGFNNQTSQDLFQYLSFQNGQGINFAATTPYTLTLNAPIIGSVDLEIILSSLQGSFVSPTGVGGPFNASIDLISVALNGGMTIVQNYSAAGNNFSFPAQFLGNGSVAVINNFTVSITQVFPDQAGLPTNSSCYTMYVLEVTNPAFLPNVTVRGDPQFIGLRGQSYQVHGIDGGVYNLISGKEYQLNSRFSFLTGPRPCPLMPLTGRKSSACWTHPGSYLTEIGLKSDSVQLFVKAGSAATGFESVTINGKTINVGESTSIIAFNSTHELTLSFGEWTVQLENSDMFVNLRSVRVNPQSWNKLASHGLLGQTWSNKKYSGSVAAIEGEVDDYLIAEGSVFGDSFVFNKFQ
jgi:hypothetical protein